MAALPVVRSATLSHVRALTARPRRFVSVVLVALAAAACGLSLDDEPLVPSPGDDASAPDGAPILVTDGALPSDAADASPDAPDLDASIDATTDGDGAPPPPTWDLDWTAIVGTGQSLSIGSGATAIVSTTPSYDNLKLADDGPEPLFQSATNLKLVPLVEPIRPTTLGAPTYTAGVYPANIRGETPHTAMASQITVLARAAGLAGLPTLHTVVGSGGKAMAFIQKNGSGNSFERTTYEITAEKALATAAGKRFGVGAIILTHGESDGINAAYEAGLLGLQSDYDADLRAITGQAAAIPLFVSQQHAAPARSATAPLRSTSTQAAWRASTLVPGIVCIGPKYQYPYNADRLHMDAFSYRRLGIKHGQAFFQHAVLKKRFRPLEPLATSRAGRVVKVAFHVPTPPLAWDAVLPTPHPEAGHPWANGKGFEVEDASGKLAIESVAIVGTTVEITLAAAPTGADLVVRYAMTMDDTGPNGYRAGEADGRLGLLRDSDPLVGIDDEAIELDVVQGSTAVTGDFSKHGRYEIVVAGGLPPETAIVTRTATSATLSAAWTGTSGKATARVRSNQHNYAVAFELPVP